ncbi:hypothetical protein OUZ56_033596 [Daphnia magna]|uniref:Uncharacterized protein n=1 Tax=Daphnia magna TaxID=35525 RepID=A0ABQ9Z3U2_9CRUS|nr:hypothetical protein OUZ56_012710 [Daphnia magna]KAK4017790.1 hypothetical protein OUZ56_033596 [Daphnia magna]
MSVVSIVNDGNMGIKRIGFLRFLCGRRPIAFWCSGFSADKSSLDSVGGFLDALVSYVELSSEIGVR